MGEQCKLQKHTPIVLDPSGKFDTFMAFQNTNVIEAKKLMMDSHNGVAEEEIKEDLRKKLVGSMSCGNMLLIRMTNSAVDILPKWCSDDEKFPAEIFDAEQIRQESVTSKLITREDQKKWPGEPHEDFQVVITSTFEKEDMDDFLQEALPLKKLVV